MKASIAPKANRPARKSTSAGTASPKASAPQIPIATYGVERARCRRPITLGTWRLVASE